MTGNNKIRTTDDLAWCLLKEEDTIDVEQFFATPQNPTTLLEITSTSDKPDFIKRIKIHTEHNKQQLIQAIYEFDMPTSKSLKSNNEAENHQLQLTIEATDNTTDENMRDYLNQIFSSFLITGRPLRHFDCTFFLPLDLILDSELAMTTHRAKIEFKDNHQIERYKVYPPSSLLKLEKGKQTSDEIAHSQAYEYFHTHIQEQLFETNYQRQRKTDPIRPIIHRRIKHGILKNQTLDLIDKEHTTSASIKDVSLYEYYNGLLLLGVRVGLPETKSQNTLFQKSFYSDTRWWEVLLYGSDKDYEKIQQLQVDHWLRYTKLVRVLYANFFEQLTEQKIAPVALKEGQEVLIKSKVKDPFSAIALYFIERFITVDGNELSRSQRLKQISDERMFTHATYVLAGEAPQPNTPIANEFERLFSYALYVDQRNDGYSKADNWAYDKRYIQQLMDKQTIRRWQSISNLSGYTDYSTIFMGFGDYFQTPTSSVHVPYIYAKTQIQILFYKLTLEHFDRRISLATEKLMKSGVKSQEFSQLRRSLINFTNKYWFKELTPQIQGKEITHMMARQQQLDHKYQLIKDKLERANEYSTTLKDVWLQEKAVFVGWLAVFLGVIAIFPALTESYLDNDKKITGISIIAAFVIATISISSWKFIKATYKFIKRKVIKDECIRK